MILVILEASSGAAVHALLRIELIGRTIPHVAQGIDVERLFEIALADAERTFLGRYTYIYIAHAGIFHQLLELVLVLRADLNDNAGILSEENLGDVIGLEVVEVDLQATLGVGEAHLQERGDETACADVVTGQQQLLADALLHSVKGIAEVFGIRARGHIAADLALALCVGAAAEAQLIKREIYMVEGALRLIGQHRAHHLADVTHLATGGHDDRTRSDDLGAIGIFLRHREAVLAGRHIDLQCAAELRERFHSLVQAGILTLLRAARPHPVGAEADAVKTFGQRSPHDIRQALSHREDRAGSRICKTRLRRVTQRCGNTLLSFIVEGYDAAVRERQLQLALALLTCHLTRHGAIDFVRQPVLAGHCLE